MLLLLLYVGGSHRVAHTGNHENEGVLVFMCFRLVASGSLWKENARVEGAVPDPTWFFCSYGHKNTPCYIRLKVFLIGNLQIAKMRILIC